MPSSRTNILLTNSKGETIVNELSEALCQNCIVHSNNNGIRMLSCPVDGVKRRVALHQDNIGSLFVCDDKEKTTKNFISLVELIKHGRPSIVDKYSKIIDDARREAGKELEVFKHNIVHINADAINEFYAFISQEYLVKNYRKLQDIIEETISKRPKESVELIARLAQYNFNLKTELSVVAKLNNPDSKPNYSNGNPRDAIMSSVYMLYPLFKKRGVHINVGEYWEKFDIDYDALQVASFYIIQNSVKYSKKGSTVNITFCRHPHNLLIELGMCSFYIPEIEESLIFNEGYQGAQARKSGLGGKGLGLYRAKRLVCFFEGDLSVIAGEESVDSQDGFSYALNKFVINLPVRMSL